MSLNDSRKYGISKYYKYIQYTVLIGLDPNGFHLSRTLHNDVTTPIRQQADTMLQQVIT